MTWRRPLEDAETVTVAFLVAVGAAEQGRPTLMFLTKGGGPAGDRGVRPTPSSAGPPMWKWIGDDAAVTFSY